MTSLAAGAVATAAYGVPSGTGVAAVLPYLTVPVLAATLYQRRIETVALLVTSGLIVGTIGLTYSRLSGGGYFTNALEWLVLVALAAAVAATLQDSLIAKRDSPQPYAEEQLPLSV